MVAKNVGTVLLVVKAFFVNPARYTTVAMESDSGGLRRKRSTFSSTTHQSSRRRLSIDEELQRFFLPTKEGSNVIDEIDMRELLIQMNMDLPSMSMIMTEAPTSSPSISLMPTVTDCDRPGTCQNRLRSQIYDISVRVGSTAELEDPNSAQSRASDWIVEQCDTDPPIDPCDVALLNLNQQRYALAVMYFSLGGDGWNSGANPGLDPAAPAGQWMSGLNYCEWGASIDGIDGNMYSQLVCDEFGNVLNLNLQSNNLMGPIPPEIGVLTSMTSYISFFNSITGPIPTSIGLITPLQTFDVESNAMDGELFKPEYAGPDGLKEIINFRASLNNFIGSIPTEIGQWSKLQNLWFADNEVTGTLPSEIGNCVEMGAFLFYSNKIGGTLPTEIGNMNNMTWFDMENNQVVGTIPEELYGNSELEQIILKSNSFSGSVSDKVGDLEKLTTFWASFNQLSGTIPTTLGNCFNMKELELQNNALSGPIPSELGNIKTIEFISVEQNELTGPIPGALFDFSLMNLRILYLNDNKLTGQIPENYGSLPRVKDLWLSNNLLSGTLPIIAEGEFLLLQELLINNNDLTGIVDESVCLIRNNTIPGGQLGVFHADCQPPTTGGAPQIQCTCCTACFE